MFSKLLYSLYVLYCFEAGLFLLLFPWMEIWRYNSFLYQYPQLRTIVLDNFFRGAVSGLGLCNILLGVLEVANFRNYFKNT